MGPMHLFRAALVALASPKTFSSGLFMRWVQQGEPGDNASPPDAKAWRKAHEVVFVDSSGWLNLAAGVSKAALAQAAAVAGRSLALLNTGTPEAFTSVFLVGQSLASLWDYWYHVTLPEQQQGGEQQQQQQQALDGDQPSWRAVEARVEALAERALGSRARLVRVLRRAPAGKVCPRHGAPTPERPHVLLAVQADAAAALRAVDMGPPADQAANAREFREFWGERSELRRFQDGSICEAVLWDEGPSERHAIPDLAVAHVLQRHLPQGTAVACHARALDAALLRRHSSPDADVRAARYAESATERLCKQLRGLSGAALRVVATQPLGAVSRGAATFPPLPQRLAGAPQDALASDHVARCLEPIEVLCQLEGSGEVLCRLEGSAGCPAWRGARLEDSWAGDTCRPASAFACRASLR